MASLNNINDKNNNNNNKVNNSYESEPSTSSGSSSSGYREPCPFNVADIDKLSLSCLLKPLSEGDNAVILPTNTVNKEFLDYESAKDFKEFNNSDSENELDKVKNQEKFKLNQNKSEHIYDIISMEENSCNAVDIPLIAEDHLKSTDCCSLIRCYKPNSITNLSFNGKIETMALKKSEDNQEIDNQKMNPYQNQTDLTSSNIIISGTKTWQPQFSDPFTFTKKSNYRKSPDLFADDDDDDDDNYDDENHNNEIEMKNVNENKNVHENENGDSGNVLSERAETKGNLSILKKTGCDKIRLTMQDDNDDEIMKESNNCHGSIISNAINNKHLFKEYQQNCKTERLMHERIRKSLSGVLPPPSVTIPQLDLFTAVLSHKDAILEFLPKITTSKNDAETETGNNSDNKKEHFVNASLLKPTCTLNEARNAGWPHVLKLKHHGLCYNYCEDSENNDYLSLSVIERFIGAETASSYVNPNLTSKPKKSTMRPKNVCQSPGNRLSHLARRRSVFSSANLANNSLRAQNLIGPQIILDKRKGKAQLYKGRNTPKRKTPSSNTKKRRKTPTSSARKRLFYNEVTTVTVAGPTIDTVKRAIFQSPPRGKVEKFGIIEATAASTSMSFPSSMPVKSEINERVEKSRRALLFSPENVTQIKGKSQGDVYALNSPLSTKSMSHCQLFSNVLKRKRHEIGENDAETEDDDFFTIHNSKLFKSDNESGLTPRALNIKSQSFCIGRGSNSQSAQTLQISQQQPLQNSQQQQTMLSNMRRSTVTSNNFLRSSQGNIIGNNSSSSNNDNNIAATTIATSNNTLQRALSDNIITKSSLTENQKKKLLWAVSQALQDKKITVKHEKFKQYAAVLARVVRRVFHEYYQKTCTSHSETMLRLSKRYVFQVMQDFTLDDIYMQAKQQIEDTRRPSNKRLMGYVAPEEYENLKRRELQNQQQGQQAKIIMSLCKKQIMFQQQQQEEQEQTIPHDDPFSHRQLEVNSKAITNAAIKISNCTSNSKCDVNVECKGGMGTKLNTTTTINHLTNSSSKSNLSGSVLRENSADGCLTRSAQKLFTGKDQRNKSPYASITISGGSGVGGGQTSSAIKVQNQLINNSNNRISDKARRQIVFDC